MEAHGLVDKFFEQADKNKDGKLTKDEIKEFFQYSGKSHHQKYTDEEINKAFEKADANKDGSLTREELVDFLNSIKKH